MEQAGVLLVSTIYWWKQKIVLVEDIAETTEWREYKYTGVNFNKSGTENRDIDGITKTKNAEH